MLRAYKCLSQQVFKNGNYRLIPIRDEDKYAIMQWRNEQIDILRQKAPITKEHQEQYFSKVVDRLFEQTQPEQLLFSFLENGVLIGYGGLVHIDWESKNGEISFITATKRNSEEKIFSQDFESYLKLIISVAFDHLNFLKVHTTFYDIPQRVRYKSIIERFNFVQEAELKSHLLINGKMSNVFIYSLINKG